MHTLGQLAGAIFGSGLVAYGFSIGILHLAPYGLSLITFFTAAPYVLPNPTFLIVWAVMGMIACGLVIYNRVREG